VPTVPERGFALVELLVVAGLMLVVLGMALPGLLAGAGRSETLAAARHLASRAEALRLQAILGGRTVGMRFEIIEDDLELTALLDGNGNGLRTTDVATGVDTVVEGPLFLRSLFPAVRAELVDLDGTPTDGVRFGQSDILAFTPRGTSSSGTLYLAGRGDWQFAVRVFGGTGRVRILERARGSDVWRDAR
jgi:type II secretory pathway pseudopilin PulG